MQRTVHPVWSGELTCAIIHKSKAKCKPWGMACRFKWSIFYSSHKLEVHGKWWKIIEMSMFRSFSVFFMKVSIETLKYMVKDRDLYHYSFTLNALSFPIYPPTFMLPAFILQDSN